FNRQEESAGGVDALRVSAGCISTTLIYLTLPKAEAGRVGRAIEKIGVLLTHKEIRLIDRIIRRCISKTTRITLDKTCDLTYGEGTEECRGARALPGRHDVVVAFGMSTLRISVA